MEAGVLDLHAAVHHDVESGGFGFLRGILVPGAELQPQRLGAGSDGLVQDAGQVVVLRNTSTMSGLSGRSAREAYVGSPRISFTTGFTK